MTIDSDVMCDPTLTCVFDLTISDGSNTMAEQHPVILPMRNGLNKSGRVVVPTDSSSSLSLSGKARFKASLTPKAMAFSAAIPMAVGTAPFQKAAIPSFDRMDLVVCVTVGKDVGFVCMRTLIVSKGCFCV